MLLITVQEYISEHHSTHPKTDHKPSKDVKGFVTNLSLPQAIRKMRQYETDYRVKYPSMRVEFSVLGVSQIEELSDKEIEMARMEKVEDLEISFPTT